MGTKALQRTGPKLKSGRDEEAAALLVKWEQRANEATRVIFDTGLFCFWIKSELPQGQFGPWLELHAPTLARRNAKDIPYPTSTLSWHMDFTKRLIENGGFTIEGVLKQLPGSTEMRKPEIYMLLPEKKVPAGLRELHTEIADKFSGKTAYQLYLELKQADEDGNVKRGRLKGCKGTTREQRADARARQEAAEMEEASEMATEWARFTEEQCDDKHLGIASDDALKRAYEAYLVLQDFMEPLALARGLVKGGKR